MQIFPEYRSRFPFTHVPMQSINNACVKGGFTLSLVSVSLPAMPGQGVARKRCVGCSAPLGIASRSCPSCLSEQPYKLWLKKKMEKFDSNRESWIKAQKRYHMSSHVRGEAVLLVRTTTTTYFTTTSFTTTTTPTTFTTFYYLIYYYYYYLICYYYCSYYY